MDTLPVSGVLSQSFQTLGDSSGLYELRNENSFETRMPLGTSSPNLQGSPEGESRSDTTCSTISPNTSDSTINDRDHLAEQLKAERQVRE